MSATAVICSPSTAPASFIPPFLQSIRETVPIDSPPDLASIVTPAAVARVVWAAFLIAAISIVSFPVRTSVPEE